jgi:hypothetical protein
MALLARRGNAYVGLAHVEAILTSAPSSLPRRLGEELHTFERYVIPNCKTPGEMPWY